jgi:hypothetical protein
VANTGGLGVAVRSQPGPQAARAGVLRDGTRRLALRARPFTVQGTLTPYAAGETVDVRVTRGSRTLIARTLAVRPARGGRTGTFALSVRAFVPGRVVVHATHHASAQLSYAHAAPAHVSVVRPQASLGARGVLVRLLQQRLAALRYAVPRSGVYDYRTELAVLAYRKVMRMARIYSASEAVFDGLLAGRGAFHVRHPRDGHHVEARLDLQVLALIDRGQVQRIYPLSSGKPSTPTVRGRFRVYRKQPGTNSHGMVDSSYFIRGYAIHGYASVPVYPASHGCLRVPIVDARPIYDWVRIGDVVWVE